MKTAASFHPLREPQGKPSKMMAFSWFISQLGFCIFVYLGMKNVIMLGLSISIYSNALAQNQIQKSAAITEKELFNKVANLDSLLFAAYNGKNLDLMKNYFTSDLEWYQDNGGLIGFKKVFENFNSIFNRDYDLKRNLIKESLEVHTIEGYGAIEIAKHQFKHIENGKLEIGTFISGGFGRMTMVIGKFQE